MLTGTFVTAAGFVPIGFAQSSAGEYTFSIFAVVTIALIVSWFVAVLFAPLARRLAPQEAEQRDARQAERGRAHLSARFLIGAMRMRWITIAADAWHALSLLFSRCPMCRGSSFRHPTGRSSWSI